MDVDALPSPGNEAIENTDLFSLVELLHEYTPRDIKGFISANGTLWRASSPWMRLFACIRPLSDFSSLMNDVAPHIMDIPAARTDPGPRQKVDLAKLCRFLPRHILACFLKEDDHYWLPYLVKAQKLQLYLVKFATKRGGALAQHVYANVPKMIDQCILSTVRSHLEVQLRSCDA